MLAEWQNRWQIGQTAWDLGAEHRYTPQLFAAAKKYGFLRDSGRIYSPGCGRAHDGAYLAAQGYFVDACDIVPEAIEAAAAIYRDRPRLTLRVEDALTCAKEDRGAYAAIFDRAVLCAFPANIRPTYINSMADRLAPGGLFLSIPFTKVHYIPPKTDGPPFAVPVAEMQRLLDERFTLAFLEEYAEPSHDGVIVSEAVGVWRKRE